MPNVHRPSLADENKDDPGGRKPLTRRIILGILVACVLGSGIVLGAVFGSRAAAPKKRRPIAIEDVTYSMATEGLLPAVFKPTTPSKLISRVQNDTFQGNSTGTRSQADEMSNSNFNSKPESVFGKAYEGLKRLVGLPPSSSLPKFDPKAIVLPEGAVAVPSWRALGNASLLEGNALASGRIVCYAKTGEDVLRMASMEYGSPCEVIILTEDRFTPYSIPRTINVSRPLLLLGRPINSPVLNCTNRNPRLIDVYPGARLETRSITLVRGFGWQAGPDKEINMAVGTLVRVQVGAFYTAVGCLYRERNNTRASFEREVRQVIDQPNTRTRTFGQMFLVVGGRLHLTGCRSFRFRPFGSAVLNAITIGRDINVVAGYAILTGPLTMSSALFTGSYWVSGAQGLAMGGILIYVGGRNVGSNLLQFQVGWAMQVGTFAGITALIGWSHVATNLLLYRTAGGQFGGLTGVYYLTGFLQGRAWGAATVFGAGQTYVQAAGMIIWQGGATFAYTISQAFFGVGGSAYIGAGTGIFNGIPQMRASLTASSSGCGFYNFVGAGSLTHIYLPSFSVNLVRFITGIATDFFVGMGWANSINNTRFSFQLANSYFGTASQAFVGIGGAVFIRSYIVTKRRYNFAGPSPFSIVVGGTGAISSETRGQNFFISKNGITRFIYNKTTKSVTQISTPRAQKTLSPTALKPGKWKRKMGGIGGHRKAQRGVETAGPSQAGATTMGGWLKEILDATGGLDPSIAKNNKVVVVQTTLLEGRSHSFTAPHPDAFKSPELKGRWGGYAKILADGLVEIQDKKAQESTRTLGSVKGGSGGYQPGLISANNSECFLCSVHPGRTLDHVGGPDACETSEACDADNPVDAYVQAQGLTNLNIMPPPGALPGVSGWANASLADTWLLWSELVVYCQHRDPGEDDASIERDCLTKEYVTEVLKSFIALNATDGTEYQITLSQGGLHPVATLSTFHLEHEDSAMSELRSRLAPAWNPDCQGWTKFDVQVTASESEAEQHLLDVFEKFYEDPTDLRLTLIENWDPSEDIQPCGAVMTEKAEHRFPSIETMPAFRPSLTGSLGPDVTIADGISITPPRTLVPGETYKVYVQNFPAGTKIILKLLAGLEQDGPVVDTIESFDDDGISELAWTAPRDVDFSPKKYYLQATPAAFPVLFGNSQVFSFQDVADARKPRRRMFDFADV